MHTVFLGIGSNINPEKNILKAAGMMSRICSFRAFSSHLITPPLDNRNEQDYINAVWKIETDLCAADLKKEIRKIEYALGRRRSEDKYKAREIDIDILVFDGKMMDDSITERDFVYGPLKEIEPDFSGLDDSGLIADLKKFKGRYKLSGMKKGLEKEFLNGPEKS